MELNLHSPTHPAVRRSLRALWSPLTLLCLCWLLALGGCAQKPADEGGDQTAATEAAAAADSAGGDEADSEEAKKEKSISVDIGRIRQGDLVLPVYADGAIRTPQSVEIKTKVGGQLVAVLVRDGDRVRKGQLLARIDPREYEIALQESRYRHLQALSQMAAEADTFTVNHVAVKSFTERPGQDLETLSGPGNHFPRGIPEPAPGAGDGAPCRTAPSARRSSSSAPAWPRPAWPRSAPA